VRRQAGSGLYGRDKCRTSNSKLVYAGSQKSGCPWGFGLFLAILQGVRVKTLGFQGCFR
jgi:hypothetical protein